MTDKIPARSKFQVDYLPPFGQPEISISGSAAILVSAFWAWKTFFRDQSSKG